MLDDLQRFIVFVHTGSVGKSAKKTKITQPAMTLSLKRLEAKLGYKLIERKGRHYNITPEGEEFYRIAVRITDLWRYAHNPIAKAPKITIGLFDNAALKLAGILSEIIKNAAFPIEIKIDRSKMLSRDVLSGAIDVAVCVLENSSSPGKTIEIIGKINEKLIPVAKTNDINQPFLLYNKSSTTRQYVDAVFSENNIIPQITAESTSPSFIKELSKNGSGIALLPENLVEKELKDAELKPLNLPYSFFRTIAVITSKQSAEEVKILGRKLFFALKKY